MLESVGVDLTQSLACRSTPQMALTNRCLGSVLTPSAHEPRAHRLPAPVGIVVAIGASTAMNGSRSARISKIICALTPIDEIILLLVPAPVGWTEHRLSDDVASLPLDLVFVGQSKCVHIASSDDFELSDAIIVFTVNILHQAFAWGVVGSRVNLDVILTG